MTGPPLRAVSAPAAFPRMAPQASAPAKPAMASRRKNKPADLFGIRFTGGFHAEASSAVHAATTFCKMPIKASGAVTFGEWLASIS